jgi:glycosyltransferase involved in cell wall biosynthesis
LKEPYDVLLLQGYQNVSDWFAFSAGLLKRLKLMFRVEANLRDSDQSWRGSLKRISLNPIFRSVETVFYSCSGNRKWAEYFGAPEMKLVLAPTSVDNGLFRDLHHQLLTNSSSVKKQANLRDDILYICSVGMFSQRKRMLDIVCAVNILQNGGIPVGLILVGDGTERKNIEGYIQENRLDDIHIRGWLDWKQIGKNYAASDVFVLASEYDPSPKVISEALNFGLPIVSTETIGVIGDLIIEGENGYTFPVGDITSLVSRLEEILTNNRLREKMRQRSLEISDHWSVKAAAQSIVEAAYHSLSL